MNVHIILPTRAMHEFLDRALLSLCNQTNPEDWRAVIVFDRTVPFRPERIRGDYRFETLFCAPEGENDRSRNAGRARNLGIEYVLARANDDDWVAFLDDDDTLAPDAVQKILEHAALPTKVGQPFDLFVLPGEHSFTLNYERFGYACDRRIVPAGEVGVNVAVNAGFLRSSGVRFPEIPLNEDTAFAIRAATKGRVGPAMKCEPLYYVRHAPPGTAWDWGSPWFSRAASSNKTKPTK
jgi:cellulose synthase/poly-beta-1,6-N-acetylglucosamine synthase-like glycosyltransferase